MASSSPLPGLIRQRVKDQAIEAEWAAEAARQNARLEEEQEKLGMAHFVKRCFTSYVFKEEDWPANMYVRAHGIPYAEKFLHCAHLPHSPVVTFIAKTGEHGVKQIPKLREDTEHFAQSIVATFAFRSAVECPFTVSAVQAEKTCETCDNGMKSWHDVAKFTVSPVLD